jgi:hypothetical protein
MVNNTPPLIPLHSEIFIGHLLAQGLTFVFLAIKLYKQSPCSVYLIVISIMYMYIIIIIIIHEIG